jgi:hypothetical protein
MIKTWGGLSDMGGGLGGRTRLVVSTTSGLAGGGAGLLGDIVDGADAKFRQKAGIHGVSLPEMSESAAFSCKCSMLSGPPRTSARL